MFVETQMSEAHKKQPLAKNKEFLCSSVSIGDKILSHVYESLLVVFFI